MNIIIEKNKRNLHVDSNRRESGWFGAMMSRYCRCVKKRMRIAMIFMFLFSLFVSFPSYAYLEEADDGSTKLSAGEQNTNMYRMTSKGKIALKKLKQIDEMMARGYAAGDGSAQNVAQVSQIVAEQNDAAVRAAAEQARQTAQILENKSALQQKNTGQAVQMIINVAAFQVRDSEIAASLLQTLSRRRP